MVQQVGCNIFTAFKLMIHLLLFSFTQMLGTLLSSKNLLLWRSLKFSSFLHSSLKDFLVLNSLRTENFFLFLTADQYLHSPALENWCPEYIFFHHLRKSDLVTVCLLSLTQSVIRCFPSIQTAAKSECEVFSCSEIYTL